MSLRDDLDEQYKIDVPAEQAGGLFSVPSLVSMDYTDLFLSVCRQFGIRYNKATPNERFFVEEVTRVTWAIQQGAMIGETVRPAFSA